VAFARRIASRGLHVRGRKATLKFLWEDVPEALDGFRVSPEEFTDLGGHRPGREAVPGARPTEHPGGQHARRQRLRDPGWDGGQRPRLQQPGGGPRSRIAAGGDVASLRTRYSATTGGRKTTAAGQAGASRSASATQDRLEPARRRRSGGALVQQRSRDVSRRSPDGVGIRLRASRGAVSAWSSVAAQLARGGALPRTWSRARRRRGSLGRVSRESSVSKLRLRSQTTGRWKSLRPVSWSGRCGRSSGLERLAQSSPAASEGRRSLWVAAGLGAKDGDAFARGVLPVVVEARGAVVEEGEPGGIQGAGRGRDTSE
jgi:hypothetical protein